MGRKAKIGIYCIENTVNGKKYIGQAIDINRRWNQHMNELNKNIHYNEHLQSSWNKYGKENFIFYIIEECKKEDLNDREIYYISLHDSTNGDKGYNISDGGYINNYQAKEVYCYYLNGIFFKKFNSISEASIYCNGNSANICNCCNGKRNMAYGFQWKYNYEEKIGAIDAPNNYNNMVVYMYDLNGCYVKSFCNVYDAMNFLNKESICKIVNCCNGKQSIAYGYQWRWFKKENIGAQYPKEAINYKKIVYCYDKITKDYVGFFNSAREAVKILNLGNKIDSARSNINSCINGKRSSAYGYIWSYLPPEEFLKQTI